MPQLKLKDVSFKAVIAGALVDNLGTMFSMSLLIMALAATGLQESEVMARMKSTSGLLLGLIIGLGWTMLGGYTAARMAKKDELVYGASVAVVGIVIAVIFRDGSDPVWFDVAGFAAMLPVGILGGWFAEQRKART